MIETETLHAYQSWYPKWTLWGLMHFWIWGLMVDQSI